MENRVKQRLEKLGRVLGVVYFVLCGALVLATLGVLGECWYSGAWLLPWETISGRIAMLACLLAGAVTLATMISAIWISPGGKADDQ